MGGVLRRHCLNPVVARLAMFLARGPLANRASFIVLARAITSSEILLLEYIHSNFNTLPSSSYPADVVLRVKFFFQFG